MDVGSYQRWYDFSRARDMMLKATSSKHAPWTIIRSDDKRKARLNCISYLLKKIPYKRVSREKVRLPKRSDKGRYNDQNTLRGMTFVPELSRNQASVSCQATANTTGPTNRPTTPCASVPPNTPTKITSMGVFSP